MNGWAINIRTGTTIKSAISEKRRISTNEFSVGAGVFVSVSTPPSISGSMKSFCWCENRFIAKVSPLYFKKKVKTNFTILFVVKPFVEYNVINVLHRWTR